MKIFVGNLSWNTDEEGLRAEFAKYGEVASATVCIDTRTNRSKGFGFVEMPNAEQAEAAISAINGKEIDGRAVRCNESQPKPKTSKSFRNGGHGGGRGGYKSGYRGGRGGYGRLGGGYGPDDSWNNRGDRDTRW